PREGSRVRGSGERDSGDGEADASDGRAGVRVDEVREAATKASHVADRNNRVGCDLALDRQVGFMDLGELEMRIEVDDAQAGRCGGLSAENLHFQLPQV